MSKKQTQYAWLREQLSKYGYEKVSKKYNQFKSKFPSTNRTSFKVSLKREYNLLRKHSKDNNKVIEEYKEREKQKQLSKDREEILNIYSKTAKQIKDTPTISMLGIPNSKINDIFNSKDELDASARDKYPSRFKGIVDKSVWSYKRLKQLKSNIRNSKRFIITTAIGGFPVDTKFLQSIDNYCKVNNTTLLVLVADQSLDKLDSSLFDRHVVFDDVKLNSNLFISTIKILPKMIEPMTGLDRIGGKSGSFIFGSPKQRLKYIPVSKSTKIPHVLMTTGSITLPKYMSAKYYQKRTDYLAEQDHKMGAIIVELEKNDHFHFRQIQMDNNGGFIDLGKYYMQDKVMDIRPECMVMGDLHCGDHNPKVLDCWHKLSKDIKPKMVVIHDGFNGYSINHHDHNDTIAQARKYIEGKKSLQEEMDDYVNILNNIEKDYDKVAIVYSNHDHFIYKYLKYGWYVNDPINHLFALDLAKQTIIGNNPIEWYVSKKLNNPNKFQWLNYNDDIYVEDIMIGKHGHLGSNGSKGTIKNIEKTVSKAVIGHSHTPQILREIYQVGTSTHLNLSYTTGPSSWFNTSCIIYKGGHRQLINSIDGRYKL